MSYVNVSTIIRAPRDQIYLSVSQPSLYQRLMPKDISIKLMSSPMKLNRGAEYEFRVKRFGIEQLWSLRVEEVIVNEKIIFQQSIGFFAKWIHTIKLEDFKVGETLVHHFVDYDLHFGLLGKLYDDIHLRRYIEKLLEGLAEPLLKMSSQ